jgi:hypothetical protein
LESRAVRPRQARYQAALRPDISYVNDSTALFNFSSSRYNVDHPRDAVRFGGRQRSSQMRTLN